MQQAVKLIKSFAAMFYFMAERKWDMQGIQCSMVTDNPQRTRKTIGRTVFEVTLHFSSTSTENPYDKLKRIILNDSSDLKKFLNDENFPDKQ